MKRNIITTADGSKTIRLEEWNEQYHSIHGAIQEAYHVFIKSGLHTFKNGDVSILEIGFGTGLNALITLAESEKHELKVRYEGVEAFPVSLEEVNALNYIEALKFKKYEEQFFQMHKSNWGETLRLTPYFSLFKNKMDIKEIDYQNLFNLIYFDAFGFRVQPELWSVDIFAKMHQALKNNGILVTYSAKCRRWVLP